MTKLRDEFQKIVDDVANDMKIFSLRRATETAALRIQDYIDAKEPVMLTDGEMDVAYCKISGDKIGHSPGSLYIRGLRSVVAAHIAKQKAKVKIEVITNFWHNKRTGEIRRCDESTAPVPSTEWSLVHTYSAEIEL